MQFFRFFMFRFYSELNTDAFTFSTKDLDAIRYSEHVLTIKAIDVVSQFWFLQEATLRFVCFKNLPNFFKFVLVIRVNLLDYNPCPLLLHPYFVGVCLS